MARGWCGMWAFHGTAYASSIDMAPVLYQPPLPRAAFSAVFKGLNIYLPLHLHPENPPAT